MKSIFACQIAKVVGTPTNGFWSQVHTFSPEDPVKKEKRGDLLAVLVLSGVPEGIEAVAAGREVLARLHEEYYGHLEGSPFERLKESLAKISQESPEAEIVAAVVFGPALYLSLYGYGQVFLKRGDKIGILLKGNGGRQNASGLLQEGDLLVLGSAYFFKAISQGVLKASLQGGSVDEAVETLAPLVLGRKDMALAAAILALVKKEEVLAIKPLEEAIPAPASPVTRPPKRLGFKLSFSFKKFKKPGIFSLTNQPIFLRTAQRERKKKIFFTLALVLLSLLGLSLFFGRQRVAEQRRQSQARELLKQAEEKLNQGKIISTANPAEGRNLAVQAQEITNQALKLWSKNNEEGVFLKTQIDQFLSSLGQEIALAEPTVFMDLKLVADGAEAQSFALAGRNLAILNPAGKKIYLLNLEKKSYKTVDYPGKEPQFLSSYDGKIYIFDQEGVYVVADSTSPVLKIKADEEWGKIVGLASYLGHVYLLDTEKNAIWRYLVSGSSFGPKTNWFKEKVDLTNSVSLAVDTSVWILNKNGIEKFNLGRKDNFTLQKMPGSFAEPVKIYTSPACLNLYVLDKGSGKIYVIAKDGTFRSVYSWEGFKQATDLVAEETLKKIFVLSSRKIYEVELK